jgi:hypothetical protein
VPAEHRSEEQIQGEITTEREQLVSAMADLRDDLDAQRRTAEIVGGAVAAGIAALAALKAIRHFRSD